MKKQMSNGEALFWTVITMVMFLGIVGMIMDASEPKCIKTGCDNDQASGSSYCYLHKLYSSTYSSKYKSTTSSSTSSSASKSSSSGSSTKSSSGSMKKTSNSSTKKNSNPYSSYDEGYEDVYDDDDYDWDRYWSDSDYADGVDDAMEDCDW